MINALMGHDFTKGLGWGDTQLSRPRSWSARPCTVSPFLCPKPAAPVAAGGLPGLAIPGYNHGNRSLPQLSLEFIAKLLPPCQGLGE